MGEFIATIKLDDYNNDQYAHFKDVVIKERPLYMGRPENPHGTPSADRLPLTIQQVIDAVKSDFAESPLFSTDLPPVKNSRFSVAPVYTGSAADYHLRFI